jgi:hypothetical protein
VLAAPKANAVLALLFLGCGACGASQPLSPTPESAVLDFARALNAGQFEAAYARMSIEYRKRVSFEAFKRQLTENPEETTRLSHALNHMHPGTVEEATVRYDDEGEIALRRENGQWFVRTPLVDFYDQSTPRGAITSFVRAVQNRRYDVVIRLIPNADKEGITSQRLEAAWSGDGREDLERLIHNLRDHLGNPIELAGDRATMSYGDQMRVQLVREDGLWKVEDPE